MLHRAKEKDDLTDAESIRRSRLAAEIKLILAQDNITIHPGILSECLSDEMIDLMYSLLIKLNHAGLLTETIIKLIFSAPREYLIIYAAINEHANVIHLLFTHHISFQNVKDFAELVVANEVTEGEQKHLRMYAPCSWLNDKVFILIVENIQHAFVILPIFLKYRIAHQLLENDSDYHRSFEVLNTLFCMARAGVRLDNHNAKVAFTLPSMGVAYELCEMNGCFSDSNNLLRMSPIEVMVHLSQNPDLVNGLIELKDIHLMAGVMKINVKNANIQQEIAMLFDATFDDVPTPGVCLGLFRRRAEPDTIRSVLTAIRAKYHINEMMLSPRN